MKQIDIPEEAERLHWMYFERRILDNVSQKVEYMKNKDGLKDCERNFIAFWDSQPDKRDLIIGAPRRLKNIAERIGPCPSNDLSEAFGYDEFTKRKFYNILRLEISYDRNNQNRISDEEEVAINHNVIKKNGFINDEYDNLRAAEKEEWLKRNLPPIITIHNKEFIEILKKMTVWTPYVFMLLAGIEVCPYCNRQYVQTMLAPERNIRAELDHFYPKSKYPYLSMSLYNLVPSCHACNKIKSDADAFAIQFNPYEDDIGDNFSYRYNFFEDERHHLELNINRENRLDTRKYIYIHYCWMGQHFIRKILLKRWWIFE